MSKPTCKECDDRGKYYGCAVCRLKLDGTRVPPKDQQP
jgi:hypothetical protein